MHQQEEQSAAHHSAERRPRLNSLTSCLIMQSWDWHRRPSGWHQSTGRRPVDACSARVWSSRCAVLGMWPDNLRQRYGIDKQTGSWSVGRSVGWPVGRLAGWLVGWLVGWWTYGYVGDMRRMWDIKDVVQTPLDKWCLWRFITSVSFHVSQPCNSTKVSCDMQFIDEFVFTCVFCSIYSGHQSILIPPSEVESSPSLWLTVVSQEKGFIFY